MLKIFNTQLEKSKAIELANELAKTLPPKVVNGKRKILSVNRISSMLEKVYRDASEYTLKNNLNFYKRSVFINSFRWSLDEVGYHKDFIDVATEGFIVEISRARNIK